MKMMNWQASAEWLLCEIVAAFLRLTMVSAGLAAIVLNLLWLGVPSPVFIYWTTDERLWGLLLWLVGCVGAFAPMFRRTTRPRHKPMLNGATAAGILVWAVCRVIFDSADRPLIGDFGDIVAWTAWISIAGGICLCSTALVPMRHGYQLEAFGSPLHPR